jgi:probable rRNA maturation factor
MDAGNVMNASIENAAGESVEPDSEASASGEADPPPPDVVVVVTPGADGAKINDSLDRSWLTARIGAAIACATGAVTRVSVLIVDDGSMVELHRRHLGLDETTDVLTFPASGRGEPLEVDIAVNVDEAARQSRGRCHPVSHELMLYVVHGLLHCLGHDDHDGEDAAAMHREEDRILDAIGIGRTFATNRDGATGGDTGGGADGGQV